METQPMLEAPMAMLTDPETPKPKPSLLDRWNQRVRLLHLFANIPRFGFMSCTNFRQVEKYVCQTFIFQISNHFHVPSVFEHHSQQRSCSIGFAVLSQKLFYVDSKHE
jgi:hypothetical protein